MFNDRIAGDLRYAEESGRTGAKRRVP
ncbi:hypothetical protein AAIH54_33510 [Pseudomonas aeruginosa]